MASRIRSGLENLGLKVAASRPLSRPGTWSTRLLRLTEPAVRALAPTPVPPTALCYEGPPHAALYLVNGWEYQTYLRRFGLRPESRVLDIGSGVGRKAWAIIRHLDEKGRYEGIDIVPEAVRWCDENLGRTRKNVRFASVDLFNRYYQDTGSGHARNFCFPFDDNSFDIVFASSVYTHMLPDEVANYLRESRRLLPRDGRAIATFFVIDEVALDQINRGRSVYRFDHRRAGCWVEHDDCPEHVVAYEKSHLEQMIASCGFDIVHHLPGSWCGRIDGYAYQDIYVLQPETTWAKGTFDDRYDIHPAWTFKEEHAGSPRRPRPSANSDRTQAN
jgi:SAM-dependent methyltransferase